PWRSWPPRAGGHRGVPLRVPRRTSAGSRRWRVRAGWSARRRTSTSRGHGRSGRRPPRRPTPRATPRTRELLRCGGDVDGLTALFLGPLGGPLLLDVLLRLPLLALLAALVLRVHGLPFDGDAPIMRYVRSVRASRTAFRVPVVKGTSSFVYRRAGDARGARVHCALRARVCGWKGGVHFRSCVADRLGRASRPDQPQHEVRVGSEPDRRVETPNRDPAFPLLEQVVDLLGDVVGVDVSQRGLRLEHWVEGVQRFGHLTCSPSIGWSRPARCDRTASATLFAPRTQSAIPGPRYAGPTRNVPGGRARSMAATRSRCPTSYCGIDRGHLTRRQAFGSGGSGRMAASWPATT